MASITNYVIFLKVFSPAKAPPTVQHLVPVLGLHPNFEAADL